MNQTKRSLAGQTIRWTFEDGPTAGKTYEHTFFPDGTVAWRDVNGAKKQPAKSTEAEPSANGKEPKGVPYASFEVAPDVHLVSYLSDSGYTLTVTLNLETLQCSGVASNAEEWYPSTGTVEVIH
ncbi:MAG: MoaF N-terminal domain-containing protein [Acidobacteriota bacterium]